MRRFIGIDLSAEPGPDDTTICKFHHLRDVRGLGKSILAAVNEYLKKLVIKICNDTILKATIATPPSSTKNKSSERDPEMHQTKKGNQWYFGMNRHGGVDGREKIIHSIGVTSSNAHGRQKVKYLLHI